MPITLAEASVLPDKPPPGYWSFPGHYLHTINSFHSQNSWKVRHNFDNFLIPKI